MRRLLIALLAGGIVYMAIPSAVVFWIVFFGAWVALHVLSPGSCPHCGKRVKFLADTCRFCGKGVKAPAA